MNEHIQTSRLTKISEFLATGFYSGKIKPAPGTWGSLAALPLAWLLLQLGGNVLLAWSIIVGFVVGWWASSHYSRAIKVKDPGEIVIDEIVAMFLVLLATPLDWIWWIVAFGLFRLFDIWKPWPVSLADRKSTGGFGIMIDDILAAIWAVLVIYGARYGMNL